MKTTKMSLANMQGKLSRAEMKQIMAGSGSTKCCGSDADCGGNLTFCNKALGGCCASNAPANSGCCSA